MTDSDDISTQSPDDAALDRAIQALPSIQQPARDLWPELQARLQLRVQHREQQQVPQRKPQRARFAWAAAAALAALLLSVWMRPDLVPGTVTAPPVAQVDSVTAEASLLNVYESQKATQMAALNFTNPAVRRQLAIWDGAVQQVRGALIFYPEDPRLLLQIDRLYRQQLNYLETLAMLDPQVAAFY